MKYSHYTKIFSQIHFICVSLGFEQWKWICESSVEAKTCLWQEEEEEEKEEEYNDEKF